MYNRVLKEVKGDISLLDVFNAYYLCRKNKRNKLDCLEFDLNYEQHLIKLWEEIKEGKYKIGPSSVFIVENPVKREICAAMFRDRIVHHLIIMKLEKLFEKEFIYDSFSCRKGKGTHFGIKRLNKHIRQITNNYQKTAYVLKLDISGYFMSINKKILLNKLADFIKKNYKGRDIKPLFWLCYLVIDNDVTKNCVFHSSFDKWSDLPKSKSLFGTKEGCGLAIGNFTSQVFSNFFLNSFDHFVKGTLKVRFYGRYVDDFYLLSNSKEELQSYIPIIKNFLEKELGLKLHPYKIYLQDIRNGVEFLGAYIKPWRIYITPRIKKNFYFAINEINELLKKKTLLEDEKIIIRDKLNSYLGIATHYNTYNLKITLLKNLHPNFDKYFIVSDWAEKVIIKN